MYTYEKINYTNYLRNKTHETNRDKLVRMKTALVSALNARNVHGHISSKYYTDGCINVSVNGKYYGVFDSNTGAFFSGYVGDRKEVTECIHTK